MNEANNEGEIYTIVISKKNKNDTWGFHLKSSTDINGANASGTCFTINKVKPEGRAFGLLQPNDKLISLNDVKVSSADTLNQALHCIATESVLTLVVQRKSIIIEDSTSQRSLPYEDNDQVKHSTKSVNDGIQNYNKYKTISKTDSQSLSSIHRVKCSSNENVENQSSSRADVSKKYSTVRSSGSLKKRTYLNPKYTSRTNVNSKIIPFSTTSTIGSKDMIPERDIRKSEPSTLQKLKKSYFSYLQLFDDYKLEFDAHHFKFTLSKKKQKSKDFWSSSDHIPTKIPSTTTDSVVTNEHNRERIYNMISNEEGYMGIIAKLKHRKEMKIPHPSTQPYNSNKDENFDVTTPQNDEINPVNLPIIDNFESRLEHVSLTLKNDKLNYMPFVKFSNVLLVHEPVKQLDIKQCDLIKKVNGVPICITGVKSNLDLVELVKKQTPATIELWRKNRHNKYRKNKKNSDSNKRSDDKSLGSNTRESTTRFNEELMRLFITDSYYDQNDKQITSIYKPTITTKILLESIAARRNALKRNCFSNQTMKTLTNTKHNNKIEPRLLSYCSTECIEDNIKNKHLQYITIGASDEGNVLGVRLRGGNIRGIYISSIKKDSRAYYSGLKVGHMVISVNSISFKGITLEEATLNIMNTSSNKSIEIVYIDMTKEYECGVGLDGDDVYVKSRIDIQSFDANLEINFLSVCKDDILHITSTAYKGRLGLYFVEKLDPCTLSVESVGCIPSPKEIISIYKNKTSTFERFQNIKFVPHNQSILCDPYVKLAWTKATFPRPVIIHSNFDVNLLESILLSSCRDKFKPFPLMRFPKSSIMEYLANDSERRLLAVATKENSTFLQPFYSIAIHLLVDIPRDCYEIVKEKYCTDEKINEISLNYPTNPTKNNTIGYLERLMEIKKKTICISKKDIVENLLVKIIVKAICYEQNVACLLPASTIEKYAKKCNDNAPLSVVGRKSFLPSDENIFDLNNRTIFESTEKQILMVPHGEVAQYDLGIRARIEGAATNCDSCCFFLQSFTFGSDNHLGLLVGPLSLIANRTLVLCIAQPHLLKHYSKIVIYSSKLLQDIPLFWNECSTVSLRKLSKEPTSIYLKFEGAKSCHAIQQDSTKV